MQGVAIGRRRALVVFLNAATLTAFFCGAAVFLAGDGLDAAEGVILFALVLAMPWTVLGFWNAVIGLVLLHGRSDPARTVYPFFKSDGSSCAGGPKATTALLVTLRNEEPEPIFERLSAMRRSFDESGRGERFRFVFLSDTDDEGLAARERSSFEAFAECRSAMLRPLYRRRTSNRGYKAGNIAEFLKANGDDYTFFVPLDSDSLMGADLVLKMVASMERHPRIGILQSLAVGMPAESGFARIFQFGMRHGMRSFTMGAAWWSADSGSYWGHNAVVRVAPFLRHCMLPTLAGTPPLGGDILSHDQLEAVFMRRAGYEVRVVPIETESFEINPPTLPDFIRRDLRWCLGNMQYLRLLGTRGLRPMGRFQLAQAILMYVAPPAWLAMTFAACVRALWGGFSLANLELGVTLFVAVFFMSIAPKIAGVADVAMTPGAVRAYGGPSRFFASAVAELFFSMLIAPIVAVSVTLFLAGLPFNRAVDWTGQNRDRLSIPWRKAAVMMAPHTAIGVTLGGAMLFNGWAAFLWSLPFAAGLTLSIPLTVVTAAPSFGRRLREAGLFAIPEERARPSLLSHAGGEAPACVAASSA